MRCERPLWARERLQEALGGLICVVCIGKEAVRMWIRCVLLFDVMCRKIKKEPKSGPLVLS